MNPILLRTGWRAALLDALVATAAVLMAYSLRFPVNQVANFLASARLVLGETVLLQVVSGLAVGLYSRPGQGTWPVRLAFAGIGGAVVGLLVAATLGMEQGVSREAIMSQVPLFGFGGALWRASVGLLVRRQLRRDLSDRFGDADLVEVGSNLGSMTGGVLRTWSYRHLLLNIVSKDLKLKYQRSLLGFAWSLLNPLVMIAVYVVAFTYILRVPTPRFVLFILVGLLAWNFFAGSVMSASEAVTSNAPLQKSVVFPRTILPFSAVLFNLVLYLLTLTVLLPVMMLFYGVTPTAQMLLFPVFLVLQVVFITGVVLLLSTASTMFRDVKHLIEVGINIVFWTTPVIYEATMIPERFQRVALLSPVASFIRAYQDIFYYGVVPSAIVWTVAIVYAAGAFICGLSVFLAYEDRFSDYL
jgi:ABC-type polysaccharide/polyol phosphate export permease